MDPISLHQIISLGAALQIGGPILAVMFIWWIDRRDIAKILRQNQELMNTYRDDTQKTSGIHREDVQKVLTQFDDYLKNVVNMYQSNVELVKNYQKIAGDFREVVVANSQISANLNNAIIHNLFCPVLRKDMGMPS
jgi:uncharacterized protein Yka (UPF0111/DUF47 family)